MNLIDRYVHAVVEYLPKDIRDDVLTELRTNIEDMLPENYTEKDVYKVLEDLGSPMKLANEYNPQKRYLIGPVYYDKYISILKMVVGICIAVSIGIALIVWIVDSPEIDIIGNIVEIITNIITGALAGTVQGVFWVTLIFVILERSGVEVGYIPFNNEKWTPDSLPELPTNEHMKISRLETLFSMICTIVFTVLLYIQPQLIAVYRKVENEDVDIISLFDVNRLKSYMIFIFALAVFQLIVFVWKYIAERWSIPLILCNSLYNIIMCILVIVMLSDSTLLNAEFIPAIAELIKESIEITAIWFDKGKSIFAGVFIVICAWDSIGTFYKYHLKTNAIHKG